jgi:hypothetical protein
MPCVREPPERHDVTPGELIHVAAGTPQQTVNHGDDELIGQPGEAALRNVADAADRAAEGGMHDRRAGKHLPPGDDRVPRLRRSSPACASSRTRAQGRNVSRRATTPTKPAALYGLTTARAGA